MKRRLPLALLLALLCATFALAQMEIVEVEAPKHSKALAGIVKDPSGAEVEGVVVEERSSDWKTVLRSTTTDSKGHFLFSSDRNRAIYYLQLNHAGFNWLRIKVQLDKKGEPQITVQLPIAA
jgi:type II secretory pathway component PulC